MPLVKAINKVLNENKQVFSTLGHDGIRVFKDTGEVVDNIKYALTQINSNSLVLEFGEVEDPSVVVSESTAGITNHGGTAPEDIANFVHDTISHFTIKIHPNVVWTIAYQGKDFLVSTLVGKKDFVVTLHQEDGAVAKPLLVDDLRNYFTDTEFLVYRALVTSLKAISDAGSEVKE